MEPRVDCKGNPIVLGSRVTADGTTYGTVDHLGDWDGEPDSDGVMRGISPNVSVKWDDGTEDWYGTAANIRWVRGSYSTEPDIVNLMCDDLEVVE